MLQNGSGISSFAPQSDQNSSFSFFPRFTVERPVLGWIQYKYRHYWFAFDYEFVRLCMVTFFYMRPCMLCLPRACSQSWDIKEKLAGIRKTSRRLRRRTQRARPFGFLVLLFLLAFPWYFMTGYMREANTTSWSHEKRGQHEQSHELIIKCESIMPILRVDN